MNVQATISKLEEMRLTGFYRAYKEVIEQGLEKKFTLDQVIAHLVDAEWDDRNNRKISRLLKNARFRYKSFFEEIDFSAQRNLDKNLILRLQSCQWIKQKEDIIITGSTGVGKSFIASALGNQACLRGLKVIYENCNKLFDRLILAKADGTYIKEIDKLGKQDLLILDDFGLKPLEQQQRLILLEILDDRNGKESTIITSQLPVKEWYDIIGEPTIADAILDRIVNSSHRIELKGESMRKSRKIHSISNANV